MTQLTPKEALAQDGTVPVKMGKGRLSGEAIARCKVLAQEGWDIKGYSVTVAPATATTPNPTAAVVKEKVLQGQKVIVELAPMRYTLDEWQAVSETPVFGQTVFSMKEVCRGCGVSLAYHVCNSPIVLGVPVKVVRK
jgi:hypothetical protein